MKDRVENSKFKETVEVARVEDKIVEIQPIWWRAVKIWGSLTKESGSYSCWRVEYKAGKPKKTWIEFVGVDLKNTSPFEGF